MDGEGTLRSAPARRELGRAQDERSLILQRFGGSNRPLLVVSRRRKPEARRPEAQSVTPARWDGAMDDPLVALRSLAERQHGVVERAQARALGVERRRLARRVVSGECRWLTPDVLVFSAAPRTPNQVAMAAVLAAGPGAALADEAALAWWGLPGFELEPAVVVTPRRSRRHALGPVRATSVLPDHHLRVLRGVRVLSPERALVEVAPRVHPKRLERALDTAWVTGLASGPMLAVVLADLAGTGRPSQVVLRRLLAERGDDWIPPASRLEARFHDLVASAGDPPFRRRVVMSDADGVIGEVDCHDPDAALVVEIDSVRFHASPTDVAHDASRDARLGAIGLHVERVGEDELLRSPGRVLARVRRLRRARTARSA
jgi:hypothetical protein